MDNAIAIIGISGTYPDAETLDQFYRNLATGVDSVRPVPGGRKRDVGVEDSTVCQPAAMLERVDQFDREFFQISRKEAEYMDPHQRLLLQLACAAIENAGYGLERFRKSRTAIFISGSGRGYSRLLETFEPTALTGNLPAALAGRIAYVLDLRGPAMVVDTACSSSLVAIAEACRRIRSGEVDFALAGGINIFFVDDQLDSGTIEIVAPDGKSKTFDAKADGSGWGEGGGFVLLRPLRKALENGDLIHAVIRGAAVNQDGARSNGMAAPSPQGQCEVILHSWQDGQIQPRELTHIEAHGTGTKLGDPIEIEGITEAFRRYTKDREFCAISSVKTNIGHLVGAAGIAGLTKLVLELKKKELFPSLHFQNPNPYIDFQNSPVFINTTLRPWAKQGNKKRLGGVSSFGLSGTNAHVVVEEAPDRQYQNIDVTDTVVPIKVSAKSLSALQRNMTNLAEFLKVSTDPLPCIAYTLNWGRDDYSYRYMQISESREAAIRQIEEALSNGISGRSRNLQGEDKAVLLLAGDAVANAEQIDALSAQSRAFAAAADRCRQILGDGASGNAGNFVLLYAASEMWSALGLDFASVIGTGTGKIVAQVLSGKLRLEEALRSAQESLPTPVFDQRKLKSIVDELSQNNRVVFVEAGAHSSLSRSISELPAAKDFPIITTLSNKSLRHGLLTVFARLYEEGVTIGWDRFYDGHSYLKVELPTYSFEPTRCWHLTTSSEKSRKQIQPLPTEADKTVYGLVGAECSETEQKLARLWGEILKQKTLTPEDDYFALGGTSLDATQIVSRIRSEFQVSLEFEDFYEYSTLRALAEAITERQRKLHRQTGGQEQVETTTGFQDMSIASGRRLSFGQERLWFLAQLQPESALYNLSFGIAIKGRLNAAALERSFTEISRRHNILRTVFRQEHGIPLQHLLSSAVPNVTRMDLTSLSGDLARKRSLEIATKEARLPFDLSSGPLWRIKLMQTAEESHLLAVVMHHIISDAWSTVILLRELITLYRAYSEDKPGALTELSLQYADYAESQRELLENESFKTDLDYWKRNLQGAPGGLELPYDFPRPARLHNNGARWTFMLSGNLTEKLHNISADQQATLFMTLLAAFQALIFRYSGQEDICIGVPVAGRHSPEVEKLIGFFINTLVIRGDASGNPTFNQWLCRIRRQVLGAFSHQQVPFDEVVKAVDLARDLDHSPLFQVMFMLQNIAMEVPELPDVNWEVMDLENGTSQLEMVFSLRLTTAGLAGTIDYNTDLFAAPTIERWAKHFGNFLEGIVADPTTKLTELPLMSATEQQQLLNYGSGPETEYQRFHDVGTLFEEQVRRDPKALALLCEGRQWTYGEVDKRSNQFARYLKRFGVGSEVIVAIAAEQSAEFILAILGVFKAGGAYLAIDVDYPAARIQHMMEEARVSAVIVHGEKGKRLVNTPGTPITPVISMYDHWEAIGAESAEPLERGVQEENLAYVVYTSGSTGSPKGVMVNHWSLRNFSLAMANRMNLTSSDRVLQFASVSFDASNVQIYPALITGAAIVLDPEVHRLGKHELLELCERQQITVLDLPGAFWRQWIEDLARHGSTLSSRIRVHMTGGESVPWQTAERWIQVVSPQSSFLSSYGPTECTVTTTIFVASHEQLTKQASWDRKGSLPLGIVLANVRVYVLDSHMQLLPTGCQGEIYIGGSGVARGYISQPEITAQQFVPDPFSAEGGARMYRTGDYGRRLSDGTLQFMGRRDEQAKIRGFRIEPAEVEAVLRSYPGVRETAVVVKRDVHGANRLIAYMTCLEDALLDSEELKSFLRLKLPEFMVPSQFVVLPSLPLTANAKVDIKALPEPAQNGDESWLPPRTETEDKLAGLWREVLGLSQVGMEQDFFSIGGHSLLATQLISRIRDVFGSDLPLRSVFESPTVRAMAKHIDLLPVRRWESIKATPRNGRLPLSFSQQRFWFLEQVTPFSGKFNIPNAVLLKGNLDVNALSKSFSGLVQRHESLRTVFPVVNGEPEQRVLEANLPQLEIMDLRQVPEGEQQRESERIIRGEAHFPFDLEQGPLIRARLIKLSQDEHLLLLTTHHIVFDGWSLYILMDDLFTQYRAFRAGRQPELTPLPIQYIDYTQWQRQHLPQAAIEEHLAYWRKRLANAPPRIMLPTDAVSTASATNGRHTFNISTTLRQSLEKLSREEDTTLFVTMLASFSFILHGYSGQQDMVIGADVANRTHVETERLIGCFFNHLPLRIDFSRSSSFRELNRQLRETVLEAISHQELPFDLLVRDLQPDRTDGAPLFQVLFVYQNLPETKVKVDELTVTPLEVEGGKPKFDITIFLRPGSNGVDGVFEYDAALFLPRTIEEMASRYLHTLESLAGDPNQGIHDMLTAAFPANQAFVGAFNEAFSR
jgi:amino acid adenylation domain-containing protein